LINKQKQVAELEQKVNHSEKSSIQTSELNAVKAEIPALEKAIDDAQKELDAAIASDRNSKNAFNECEK
jgi:hypothetical protein